MPRIVENALLIYTDGSLYPKGRRGGYGIVFIHVDNVGEERIIDDHSPPGIIGTTNQRMELQACIEALARIPEQQCFQLVDKVVIRTDSRYITDNYRNALGYWRNNRWRNREGRPIENADLWKDFARAFRRIYKRVDIEWVKGHGKGRHKDHHNIKADKLAESSAKNPLSQREFLSSVRRKHSSNKTIQGSVELSGQLMIIHVIETKRMRVQKVWKYRYEVMSKDRPDYLNVDFIYSNELMRDGHYYEVRVNENKEYPLVLEVIREVDAQELTS